MSLADYTFEGEIGEGGQASVYLAKNNKTGVRGVLKYFPEERWFKTEVSALKNIEKHPGIVKMFDYFEDDSEYWIFLEYVEGETLMDTKIPGRRMKGVFKQIIGILDHIHKCGYLYGDIKLENFICGFNYRIKIIDFGLSMKLGEEYAWNRDPETLKPVSPKASSPRSDSSSPILRPPRFQGLGALFPGRQPPGPAPPP